MKPVAKPILFFAFANDRQEQARYLRNLPEEARQVQKILAAAEARGHGELVVRQNATASDILDIFQDPRYRDRVALFHFGGHANGYQLLVETADGQAIAANAGGLARFLAQQRGLQLIFLNACATEGQVMDLLDVGVPAVIATDMAVEDATATAFAARFYRGLDGGATIETAFQEARAAMQMQGGPTFRHLGAVEVDSGDRIPWRLHYRAGAEAVAGWNLPLAASDPLFGLPNLPSLDLPDRPYCYLDWYRRNDAEIFFGRGQEIRTIYDCVTATGSPPIVLFYGQSGVGKSSLLAAGLLPRLEASHSVRYTRRDQTKGLLGTLAAALESSPADDLSAAWRTQEAEMGRPLVVVLDQVEEVFTRPDPQQPEEMAAFLAGLEHLFGDASRRPHGRLILSFRKERLAEIQRQLVERKLPRREIFLERLGRRGIVEVVAGPQSTLRLRSHYGLSVADDLSGLIADDLLADRESPVAPMLAILLADMWDAAKARNYHNPHFDQDLYHDLRSRGLSLDDFLGRQLQTLHTRQPDAVDSGLVLDLLAYHTTPLMTAEQRTLADLTQTYQHRQDLLPDLVQECRDLYLLVDPSQNQPGAPSASRLTHDTLAPHVRKRFDESDAPGQRAWRILESRSAQWTDDKMGPVLDEGDLALVEAGQSGMRDWDDTRCERLLIQASRLARVRRQRQRRLVAGTMLVLALALFLAVGWNEMRNVWLRSQVLAASPQADMGTFSIDRYEVSIQQYAQCNRANPDRCPQIFGNEHFDRFEEGQVDQGPLPITHVNAIHAAQFCQWLGRRLPTIEEWETAVRRVHPDLITPEGELSSVTGLNIDTDTPWSVKEMDQPTQDGERPLHLIGNVSEWTASRDDGGVWEGQDGASVVRLAGGSFETPSPIGLPISDLWILSIASVADDDRFGFRCASG
jgi:hypothetical protein